MIWRAGCCWIAVQAILRTFIGTFLDSVRYNLIHQSNFEKVWMWFQSWFKKSWIWLLEQSNYHSRMFQRQGCDPNGSSLNGTFGTEVLPVWTFARSLWRWIVVSYLRTIFECIQWWHSYRMESPNILLIVIVLIQRCWNCNFSGNIHSNPSGNFGNILPNPISRNYWKLSYLPSWLSEFDIDICGGIFSIETISTPRPSNSSPIWSSCS